ncbi:MAG: hemerythrin domain-containing protein [Proteobacteria bacterium]|nr:MAG: hemerythrin domain-containing protein [Pseudomonadota bacterium]
MKKTTKASAKSASKTSAKKSSAASKATVKKQAKPKQEMAGDDIIDLILEDHKPLKKLIKVLKNSDKYDLEERQEAFEEFAPLLITHAKPEEQTLYIAMKDEEDLREEGYEGDVEHALADQLLEEIKRTDDEDLWSARVKVLAEMVEHHIEEEEEEMLPDFRKNSEVEQRAELGAIYVEKKAKLEAMGGKDSPEEDAMPAASNKAKDKNKSKGLRA